MGAVDQGPEQTSRPALEIKGEASPEEVAAVVTVLQAVAAAQAAAPAPRPRPSEWSAPARRHRQPFRTGPGMWTSGALPR